MFRRDAGDTNVTGGTNECDDGVTNVRVRRRKRAIFRINPSNRFRRPKDITYLNDTCRLLNYSVVVVSELTVTYTRIVTTVIGSGGNANKKRG